jgi:hypothetical protein
MKIDSDFECSVVFDSLRRCSSSVGKFVFAMTVH